MKILLAQPAIKRFQWELEVVLTNIQSFGSYDIVVLFSKDDDAVPAYIANKYGVQCHVYEDNRDDKIYQPSIRPYLWWRYLSEDKQRETQTYFQIDSDIIFREMPTIDVLENTVHGSDCGGYIDYDYLITRKNGEAIVQHFADIVGVSVDCIKQTPGIGAQWVIPKPTADMWLKIYQDSNKLWHYLAKVDSDIQKWTAEMWAQLYGHISHGYNLEVSPELDFCRPTDDVKMWDMVKILHNAGVVDDEGVYFFKGKYVNNTPFDDDLSFVRRDKASIKYVEAINKVKR